MRIKNKRLLLIPLVLSLTLLADTETLRPNGVGSATNMSQEPVTGNNWDKVDEETEDSDVTYVYTSSSVYDLYEVADHSTGSGTINSVTIHAYISRASGSMTVGYTTLRTEGTTHSGTGRFINVIAPTYWEITEVYTTNPTTDNAWTWSQVDAMEMGSGRSTGPFRCTQVYAVVDYTPSPAPPNIPTLLRIFDNAIYNAYPDNVCTLSVKATDPEGDDIRYEIQWDTDPLLGSPSSDTTSYYGSGVEATTTIDLEPADPEQVYYWKTRAMITAADWLYRKKITIDHTKVGVITPAPWYNTDWYYRNKITIDHTKVGEAPWYNADWQYRKKITIDNTKVPNTDQINFPVLINRTDTDWKVTGSGGHVGQSDGGDILFTLSNGTTKLDHEIEEYDSLTGELIAWVEVDTVYNSTDTDIYIYYGNTGGGDQWNVTGTWDEGGDNNFKAVWHLNETTGGSGAIKDATQYGNHGTDGGSPTFGAAGKIDNAIDFDGGDDYITLPSTASLRPANITINAWTKANPSTSDEYCTIIGHPYDDEASWDAPYFSWLINRDVSNTGGQYMITTAGEEDSPEGTPAVWDNTWHMVTLVYDGVTIQAYVDAQSGPSEVASPGGNIDYDASNPNVMIGMRSVDASPFDEYYGGLIDEVRISNVARSADWIATSYNNQDSASTFYSVGSVEEQFLTNFPVLINRTDTDWKYTGNGGYVGQSDGGDILFTSSDGTSKLDHEIEEYVASAGSLIAWVEVDTVYNSTDTDIYIYYGNATVGNQWNVTGTWDEGGDNNFRAVWHLNETTGGSGAIKDATSNNYDGTDYGPTLRTTGMMSKGFSFDGITDYVDMSLTMNPQSYDDFTISAWYKSTDTDVSDDEYIYNHHTSSNNEIMFGPTDDGAADNRLRLYMELPTDHEAYYSTTDVVDQAWHYLVAVRTATGRIRLYVDDAEELDDPGTTFGTTTFNLDGMGPWIGDHPGSTEQVHGILDEVRVSNIGRDAKWILTEYNNQSSPNTFYSVGITEEQTLTNLPVLINRTDTDWKYTGNGGHVGQSDGGDILFTLSDGTTQLDHEIEEYVASAGSLIAWVEVDTVSALTDTDIYIYYGNATVANQWNVTGTWDEGGDNNYEAVWHLSEITGGAGAIKDATSNNYDGTDNDSPTFKAAGKIDNAIDFDGNNEYVEISNAGDFLNGLTAITVSLWVKSDEIGTERGFICYQNPPTGSDQGVSMRYDNIGVSGGGDDVIKIGFGDGNSGIGSSLLESSELVQTTNWQYVVATWKANEVPHLFLDGDEDAPTDTTDGGASISNVTSLLIGKGPKDEQTYEGWNGIIDEVRVSSVARTANWIATCYNNQDSPSTFYSVDAEEGCDNSLWSGIRSFTMDIELGTSWPYWYQVAGAQFEQDTMNNVEVVGNSVELIGGQTQGTLTSPPIVFADLFTESSNNRSHWDGAKWTKSSAADSIGLQIEYKDGGTWSLVLDDDIPGNSNGFFFPTAYCYIDLSSISTSIYDTLRMKATFKSYTAKSASDPALLMWALGSKSGITGVSSTNKPLIFALSRNKPNPFTNRTEIRYQIPKKVKVDIQVFDVMGRSVVTLINKEQKPGYYSIQWRGTDKNKKLLPSGVYFLRMEAGDFKATQKMVRLR